jgi:hypothetical protein
MKNEHEEYASEEELQNEINKRLQELIDRKKCESDALRKILNAIEKKSKENKTNENHK